MEVSAELEAQLTAVREEERAKLLAQQADFEVKLAAAREEERQRVLAEVGRTEEIRKLSAQLTSGPKAFWHKPAELEALLGKLTDDDRKVVGDLLLQVQTKGLVDLGERGHSHADGGARLTDEAQAALTAHLHQGGSVETFFAANPELGNAAQYANIESK